MLRSPVLRKALERHGRPSPTNGGSGIQMHSQNGGKIGPRILRRGGNFKSRGVSKTGRGYET